MKLYFYEMSYSGNKIKTGEAEVIEKPKTYSPVNKFPDFYYGSCVSKDDIGQISGCGCITVILTENNPQKAYELFFNQHKNIAIRAMEEVDKQNGIIDFLKEWIELESNS